MCCSFSSRCSRGRGQPRLLPASDGRVQSSQGGPPPPPPPPPQNKMGGRRPCGVWDSPNVAHAKTFVTQGRSLNNIKEKRGIICWQMCRGSLPRRGGGAVNRVHSPSALVWKYAISQKKKTGRAYSTIHSTERTYSEAVAFYCSADK